jgi:Na+-driven multidrug efflux pump
LRAEGNAILSLVGIASGAVINIALDPLFIFTFDLGIGGAAIATVISQAIGFCILGSHYVTGRAVLRIRLAFVSFRRHIVGEILRIGSPSLGRQVMASVGMVILNKAAGGYSDAAIAAMTIANRVGMLVYSTIYRIRARVPAGGRVQLRRGPAGPGEKGLLVQHRGGNGLYGGGGRGHRARGPDDRDLVPRR